MTVVVQYPSQQIAKNVQDPVVVKLCKAIVKNRFSEIVKIIFNSRQFTEHVSATIQKKIAKEICATVSKTSGPQLRNASPHALQSFKWEEIGKQMQLTAPLFHSILQAASGKSFQTSPPLVYTAASMLKIRNPEMSRLHYVVGLLLDEGGCKDKVRP